MTDPEVLVTGIVSLQTEPIYDVTLSYIETIVLFYDVEIRNLIAQRDTFISMIDKIEDRNA